MSTFSLPFPVQWTIKPTLFSKTLQGSYLLTETLSKNTRNFLDSMALSALTWTLLISLFAGFVICIVVIFGIVIPPEEHQLLLEIQNKIEKSHDYKQRISDYRKEYQYPLYELPLYSKDNYDFVHRLIHNVTGFKQNGTFIQSLIRTTDYKVSPSGYLTDNFQWKGVILEPEIQKLESFQEENAFRPSVQIIDACVAYTKESIGRRKRSPRGGGRGGRGGRGRMSGIGRYGSNRGWGAGNIAATQTGSRMFWFSNSLGGYTRSRHNKGLVSCYSIDVIFKALNATSCDLFMLGGYGKELYVSC